MEADWLKNELSQPGRSQSALARFLKIDASIVNRMCGGGPGREITSKEADKILAYLAGTTRGAEKKPAADQSAPRPPLTDWLPIRRTAQAGAFLAVDPNDQSEPERFRALPDPDYPKARQWLTRIVGDSMDALDIVAGDLVQCVDVWAIHGYSPRTGEIVEVERRRDGGDVEVTLKQVEVTESGTLLWPRSNNPRWTEPLSIRAGLEDDEEISVHISGLMVALIRTNFPKRLR